MPWRLIRVAKTVITLLGVTHAAATLATPSLVVTHVTVCSFMKINNQLGDTFLQILMSAVRILPMPASMSAVTRLGPTHANAILDIGSMATEQLVQVST